jgi:hypothetical protein
VNAGGPVCGGDDTKIQTTTDHHGTANHAKVGCTIPFAD